VKKIIGILYVCTVAFATTPALAQFPPVWGVSLCQIAYAAVQDNPTTISYQYPALGSTTPSGSPVQPGCSIDLDWGQSQTTTNSKSDQVKSDAGNAELSLSGTAMLGTLTGSGSATAIGLLAGGYGGAVAQTETWMGWEDTFTVNSSAPDLVPGTLLPLNVTFKIEGKLLPPPAGQVLLTSTFAIYQGPADGANITVTVPKAVQLTSLDGTTTYSGVVNVPAGESLQFGAQLQLNADAVTAGGGPSVATISGPDSLYGSTPNLTLTVYVDPGAPGVCYTTASGTPYYSTPPTSCAPPTCAQLLQNAVKFAPGPVVDQDGTKYSLSGQPVSLTGSFTPNFGYTLPQAAEICNVDHFNWQQEITAAALPLSSAAIGYPQPTLPTFDPPEGGWAYCASEVNGMTNPEYNPARAPCQGAYPYYYSYPDITSTWILPWSCNGGTAGTVIETSTTLLFCDAPTAGSASQPVMFITTLVGVPGKAGQQLTKYQQVTWQSTFDGTVGGVSGAFGQVADVDPGSGTGGVTLLHSGPAVPGDINGDGQVDLRDLAYITSALNTPAIGPGDPRDLNNDGVINALDARILVTLCTHPGCATN
jgi:hypothetical protein